jgi:hypothetical protein
VTLFLTHQENTKFATFTRMPRSRKQDIDLTLEQIQSKYHLPLFLAALEFKIPEKIFRERCKELGIKQYVSCVHQHSHIVGPTGEEKTQRIASVNNMNNFYFTRYKVQAKEVATSHREQMPPIPWQKIQV